MNKTTITAIEIFRNCILAVCLWICDGSAENYIFITSLSFNLLLTHYKYILCQMYLLYNFTGLNNIIPRLDLVPCIYFNNSYISST